MAYNCVTSISFPTNVPDSENPFYPYAQLGTESPYYEGGKATVNPTQTTTYTVTCFDAYSQYTTPKYVSNSATITIAVPQADLTTGSILPTTVSPNGPVPITSTVSNGGNAATSGGFLTLFQRANDASGTGAVDIGTHTRGSALPGSQGFIASVSYDFPSLGTWYVRACADKSSGMDTGSIAESNENNNCGAWTAVKVAYQCDDDLDNNGTGGTDFPADPSCDSLTDDSEDGSVSTVSCSPSATAIDVPGTVTYTASGGSGAYTWTPSAGTTVCDPNPGNPTVCTITAAGEHSMSVSTSGGGSGTCSENVTAGCAAPESVSLTANGQSDTARVQAGSNVTLAWQISGIEPPTTCTLTGVGDVTPAACTESDSQAVGPITTQQVYTLTCGGVSDSVIVNVASGAIEF